MTDKPRTARSQAGKPQTPNLQTATSQTGEATGDPAVAQAKGAAREAIGKLLGDDAEVRRGQRQQAGINAPPKSSQEQT